ncbi:Mitochondrial copper homeostasis protein [Knufia fluminis]|uniref:Mitochondrial copper homeostasis protein n=1 Tax=Knufia fluminis TaxID=191047 RepID=A0AAN8EKF5_9EURO|nr:Mitochondrial copper homeostasis protein [Knufia fluminis]
MPTTVGDKAEQSGKETIWDKNKDEFKKKSVSKYYDPCQDAANKSIRCMNRNNGDREMCQDFFQAYRDCKKEWQQQMREARWK